MSDAADRVQKQRGRPWSKGISGNPRGRGVGCRNRATRAAEALLDGEAEALTRKAIELALAGDTTALKLCLERLLPPHRNRAVAFKLPEMASTAGTGSAPHSSGCMRSSGDGSRPSACCPAPKPRPYCSGRCSPPARSRCAAPTPVLALALRGVA